MWLDLSLKSRHAGKVPQILCDIRAASLPLMRSEPHSSFKHPFTDPMCMCTLHKNLAFFCMKKTLYVGKMQLLLLSYLSQALGQRQGPDVAQWQARAWALGWAKGVSMPHRAAPGYLGPLGHPGQWHHSGSCCLAPVSCAAGPSFVLSCCPAGTMLSPHCTQVWVNIHNVQKQMKERRKQILSNFKKIILKTLTAVVSHRSSRFSS